VPRNYNVIDAFLSAGLLAVLASVFYRELSAGVFLLTLFFAAALLGYKTALIRLGRVADRDKL
jgi:hypothetical protein